MVGLYLLMTRVFFKYMATILGLVVPPDTLPPALKTRFDEASAPILAAADCEIVVARRGLYNAVAQPGLRRITVGLSLVEFLNVEQLRAILTHELGHLEDRVYQPRVTRFQQLGALCFLFSGMMTDSRIDYAVFYSGILVLLTVYFFLLAPKKARLHGEKVADGYVLRTDVRLYRHLQEALSRIYILNGLDKDHCKTHDSDHLDLDERQAAVASGKIQKRQNFTRRTAVLLVILIVSAGLTVAYSYFFPGPERMCDRLHNRFHAKMESDPEAAQVAIEAALALCENGFPGYEKKTSNVLRDLARFHLRYDHLQQAESQLRKLIELEEADRSFSAEDKIESYQMLITALRPQNKEPDILRAQERITQLKAQGR
jgi:Zn-dependent protease with chaperone function